MTVIQQTNSSFLNVVALETPCNTCLRIQTVTIAISPARISLGMAYMRLWIEATSSWSSQEYPAVLYSWRFLLEYFLTAMYFTNWNKGVGDFMT